MGWRGSSLEYYRRYRRNGASPIRCARFMEYRSGFGSTEAFLNFDHAHVAHAFFAIEWDRTTPSESGAFRSHRFTCSLSAEIFHTPDLRTIIIRWRIASFEDSRVFPYDLPPWGKLITKSPFYTDGSFAGRITCVRDFEQRLIPTPTSLDIFSRDQMSFLADSLPLPQGMHLPLTGLLYRWGGRPPNR